MGLELTERKKQIMRAVVENYITTAEPVGSKAIMDLAGLKVSSATIRNEMADLEEMGLLEQPHTSAGRIPSAKGYRVYVNELMQEHKLSMQETENINQALHMKMAELDKIIDQAGKAVSHMTNYPTFAVAAPSEHVTIRRFNLLPVEESSFIAVLMSDNSVVRNKIIKSVHPVTEPQLQLLTTLLNTSFIGLSLENMGEALERVGAHADGDSFTLISLVVNFAQEVLEELGSKSVHTAGIANLLTHPEYQSIDKAQPLMEYLTEDIDPTRFPVLQEGQTKVLIGPENVSSALKDTSVVVASYDIGDNMRGIIGVVGPTRMDYAKVTARLSYFAEGLSRMFGKGELPPGGADSGAPEAPDPAETKEE